MKRPPEAVVKALVENHRRFLAFLERRTGNRAEAEDLLQAAFVRAVEKGDTVRDEESVVAWFYRVLRNALVDRARSRDAERAALDRFAREIGDASAPPPEVRDEVCACFRALLPALRPEYARAIERVDLGGARPVDLARELGITPNNAMVRLSRARQALRAALGQACGTCAEHGCLECACGRPGNPPTAV